MFNSPTALAKKELFTPRAFSILIFVVCSVLLWITPLIIFSLVGKMMSSSQLSSKEVVLFFIAVIGQFGVGLLSIHGKGRILREIQIWFAEKTEIKTISRNKSSAVIFRNLEIFADNYLIGFDFYMQLICLFVTLLIYIYLFGFASMFIVLSILLIIPMVRLLTSKSDYYFKHALKITDIRTHMASQLIDAHVLIASLGFSNSYRVKKLKNVLKKENLVRNYDSFYRCLELYFEIFLKFLPCLLIIIVYRFVLPSKYQISSQLFWLTLPLIGVMFQLPRGLIGSRTVFRSQKVLSDSFLLRINRLHQKVYLNKDWEVWKGTLIDNILYTNDSAFMMQKLNLEYEIGLGRIIESQGLNISAGQKTRIIFLRALNIALKNQENLYIDLSFDSLDAKNKNRIRNMLDHYNGKISIELSEESKDSLFRTTSIPAEVSNNTKPKIEVEVNRQYGKYKIFNLFKEFRLIIVLFILAGIANSMIYSLIGDLQLTNGYLIFCILLILAGSILASIGGVLLEKSIRDLAAKKLIQCFTNRRLKYDELKNIFMIEYNNVIEKYAFYVHDLAWISSLFFVTLITVLVSSKVYSLIPIIVLVGCFLFLFVRILPSLQRARDAYVQTGSELLTGFKDLLSVDLIESMMGVDDLRENIVRSVFTRKLEIWTDKKINMLFWKSLLSLLGKLCVGIVFLILIILFERLSVTSELKALAFGALFAIDAESIRLFAAFSGYNMQLKAKHALEIGAEEIIKKDEIFGITETQIQIKSFVIAHLGKKTKILNFKFGLYKLSSFSGDGKSSFMKELLMRSFDGSTIKASYLDTNAIRKTEWIQKTKYQNIYDFLTYLQINNYKVILIDELLLSYDISDSQKIVHFIDTWARDHKILVLIADHREMAVPTVNLAEILEPNH
ncbi:MAG: hypothetical protein ACOYOK_01320 [Pseudobdellovibrionaceae bacterium]